MKAQFSGMMKQVQQMQDKMQRAQADLQQIEVTGESGGGLCKIIMTCKNSICQVSIDDSLFTEDKSMLEDLIAAALNDAIHKAELVTQEKMGGITGDLNIPLGFKMPF